MHQTLPESDGKWDIKHSCGVQLTEWNEQENVFDAVITDPPYVCNAENYGDDERDIATNSPRVFG